ncbi:MAG: NADPH:quinone oxidoreductase family protein [Alphaproteobacteria bacterium]
MKAVVCREYGPPESLKVEEMPDLEAGPGQAVVNVKACGVNFPDTLIIQGKYQFQPPFPFSPGGEVSGIVSAIGDGVTNVKVGDLVIASTGWGGFAEQVVAQADKLITVPGDTDPVMAAGFIMTYGTSHHALKDRAEIQPGETLLVLGAAGGVGIAAVDLGKAMGATVIAAASTDEKLQVCKEYGADHLINYETEDLKAKVKEITGGKGVDVIYDPVGDRFAEPALRSIGWKGRYLVVGFAAGEIPKIPLNLALLKGCQICGVFWGRFTGEEPERNQENIDELVSWMAEGKIKPLVSKTYPFEQAPQAIQDLMDRKAKGKICLVTD